MIAFLCSQGIVYLGWNYPMNRWWVFPALRHLRLG
jgi:hypothetical protein